MLLSCSFGIARLQTYNLLCDFLGISDEHGWDGCELCSYGWGWGRDRCLQPSPLVYLYLNIRICAIIKIGLWKSGEQLLHLFDTLLVRRSDTVGTVCRIYGNTFTGSYEIQDSIHIDEWVKFHSNVHYCIQNNKMNIYIDDGDTSQLLHGKHVLFTHLI